MKLHAFETGTDPRFRAYTRDRGRKHLQATVRIRSASLEIGPKQWRYVGPISTTGLPLDYAQPIHARVRQQGYVVVRMPPLRILFHVFDLQLDAADLRIYSHDRELKEFSAFRKRLELSPDGHLYGGGAPIYRGELELPTEASADTLRLNYRNLQRRGFDVVVVSAPGKEEVFRRRLQRELPEVLRPTMKEFGVELIDLNVDSVTFKSREMNEKQQPTPSPPPAQQDGNRNANGNVNGNVNVTINNSNVNNPVSQDPTPASPKPRLFDGWVAKLLGLLAAIATILALFRS